MAISANQTCSKTPHPDLCVTIRQRVSTRNNPKTRRLLGPLGFSNGKKSIFLPVEQTFVPTTKKNIADLRRQNLIHIDSLSEAGDAWIADNLKDDRYVARARALQTRILERIRPLLSERIAHAGSFFSSSAQSKLVDYPRWGNPIIFHEMNLDRLVAEISEKRSPRVVVENSEPTPTASAIRLRAHNPNLVNVRKTDIQQRWLVPVAGRPKIKMYGEIYFGGHFGENRSLFNAFVQTAFYVFDANDRPWMTQIPGTHPADPVYSPVSVGSIGIWFNTHFDLAQGKKPDGIHEIKSFHGESIMLSGLLLNRSPGYFRHSYDRRTVFCFEMLDHILAQDDFLARVSPVTIQFG